MDERLRKELLRSELKERNKGKKIIRCKYRPKYPDSAEREYVRLINAYMTIEKEVLMKYIPEIKQILNDGTQLHTDSKKDNEKKRRTARFSALDNTIVRLTILFKTIQRELDSAFGLYDLKRQINRIANLDHKLTVREWKKAVSKTLGIDLLDDYYSGEYYAQMLEKWVSDNVDLIKTVPNQSLERMKELVYESYMKGSTTTNIVREIQRQYGMSKRHASNIERMWNETYLEYFFDDEPYTIDADTMQALGLNMYSKSMTPKKMLYNAFCCSEYDDAVIMHPQQIECLNYLMKGENLLISAPTSFGKTFVALEYMSRKELDNIVFVVPTLALMNELFVKIKNKFGQKYNIIQNGYENVVEKNIYIIVPERADISLLSKIKDIDLLVFDEIYKLQRRRDKDKEDKRIISLCYGLC